MTSGSSYERKESLEYSVGASDGYAGGAVTEFCTLKTVETGSSTIVGAIAPTLTKISVVSGLTQANVELTIGNYTLMEYPEGVLYLYYAVYEEVEVESSDGTVTELELVGFMRAEAEDLDDLTSGERSLIIDSLESEKTYRLYIYYKDTSSMTDETKSDYKDENIFSGLALPDYGEYVTADDGYDIESIVACFTATSNSSLDPTSAALSPMQKIMGGTSHLVTAASMASDGTVTAAVYDYYETIETQSGIVIQSLSFDLGNTNTYFAIDEDAYTSNKTLVSKAVTYYIQDEYTWVYFILERCSSSDSTSSSDNWTTVLAPSQYYDDNNEMKEQVKEAGIYCDMDGDAAGSNVAKITYEYYKALGDLTWVATPVETSEGSSRYTVSLNFTYYPDGIIEPGYYYRIKTLIFQGSGMDDTTGYLLDPELVSLASTSSTAQYRVSNYKGWKSYSYSELNPLVQVTNIVRKSDSFTLSIRGVETYYTWLDRYFYMRLCEWNGTSWEVLEDNTYYGDDGSGTTWNNTAFAVGTTYSISFQNLDESTTYCLRFYGLTDTDYDNYVNVMGTSSVPLAANYEDTAIFGDLTDHTDSDASANLTTLYNYFLGISGSSKVADLNINSTAAHANDVLLCESSSITTFANGYETTIGTFYQADVNTSTGRSVTFRFENASGLGEVYYIEYNMVHLNQDTVKGFVYSDGTSPMDDGATEGDVELTITNSSLSLTSSDAEGEWQVQLVLYGDSDGDGVYDDVLEKYSFSFDV
ncbi:MAG: hypothetical protein LUE31_05260 [Lachnospiraceae bacterium]|nr:hypothetical protein [Lachnospiraceae bacterium]